MEGSHVAGCHVVWKVKRRWNWQKRRRKGNGDVWRRRFFLWEEWA
jgi:uncharacterized membrane protein